MACMHQTLQTDGTVQGCFFFNNRLCLCVTWETLSHSPVFVLFLSTIAASVQDDGQSITQPPPSLWVRLLAGPPMLKMHALTVQHGDFVKNIHQMNYTLC